LTATSQQVEQAPAADEKLYRTGTLIYTRAGLTRLFMWLLTGDFFWQLRERAITPAMQLLLRKFGASDRFVGLMMGTMPAALGITLSPIVSFRSDRFRSGWGRRIPFLLLSTPPAFLSFIGIALSPAMGHRLHAMLGSRSPGLEFCVLGLIALFWGIFDVAMVVTNAVHGALINDVVPKEVIGRFFGLFRVISLGAGMLFHEFLLKKVETQYLIIFFTIGIAYLICFTVMCLVVKEGQYPPPPPEPSRTLPLWRRIFAAIITYGHDCFSHPLYLWFFFSFFLAYVGFEAINLFSLYFSQSVGMSTASYGHYSAIQLFCSLVQAPIIGWLADKIHPLRITIFALFMYALTTGIAFVVVRNERTFALAHVICGTCSGMWLTATAPLPQVLLPRMKFATFASVLAICYGCAKIVIGPMVGTLLDWVNVGKTATQRDYHLIYGWASFFMTLSLIVTLIVHRYFMRYGGPKGYVPPVVDDLEPREFEVMQ
jgi:MFS family permease